MSTAFFAQLGSEAHAFDGDVAAVCSHALYAFAGERMIVFHDIAYGILPFGVAIDGVVDFLSALAPTVEANLSLTDGAVLCGDRRIGLRTVARHATAPTYKLSSPRAARLAEVEDILAERGSKSGVAALFSANTGGARTHADALSRAMTNGDGDSAAEAATALLGLGRGLTPSGDDFICGFFSLLLAADKNGIRIPACTKAVAKRICDRAPTRTSRISAAYVCAALDGKFFSIYDSAAAALCAEDADTDALCDFVLSMGASSGTDTLCGALCAAKLITK